MSKWIQLWALVRVSMLETLGRTIAFLLTFASAMWILVLPLLQFQRFSEDGRMARDCALATAFLFGLMFVIGHASRLAHALTNGTAAAVLVKPLSRLFWVVGFWLGGVLSVLLFMVVQVGVIVLAEAFSPTYRWDGGYADVPAILRAMGLLLVPVVLGALNQRFRGGRFVLPVMLTLPVMGVILVVMEGAPHLWGITSGALAIFLALVQMGAVAMALAAVCSPGLTIVLASVFVVVWGMFLQGSAYMPLDALSMGGAVPLVSLAYLLPQTLVVVALAFWAALGLLKGRAVV